MPWLLGVVSNVLLALLLALTAWFVQRWLRWHGVAHILWVLVLVKLVTPPLVSVPIGKSPGSVACALGTCSSWDSGAWPPKPLVLSEPAAPSSA